MYFVFFALQYIISFPSRTDGNDFFLQVQVLYLLEVGHRLRWSRWKALSDETILPLADLKKTIRVAFALVTDVDITLVK